MNKTFKTLLGILALVFVIALIVLSSKKHVEAPMPEENLGGLIETLPIDFMAGFRVNGTTILSSTGALTPSSITTTGTTSLTGATSIGSVTAGLNYYKPVVALTADTTVTIAQTGSIFNMGTAGVDVTLPAPTTAAGVHYRFVVSAAFATTDMTITVGNTDLIEGSLIVAGAVVACDAADTITIAAANEDIGDFIDLYSNGVKWMIGANQAMTASNHACSG